MPWLVPKVLPREYLSYLQTYIPNTHCCHCPNLLNPPKSKLSTSIPTPPPATTQQYLLCNTSIIFLLESLFTNIINNYEYFATITIHLDVNLYYQILLYITLYWVNDTPESYWPFYRISPLLPCPCYGMDLFATAKDLFGFVMHCYWTLDMVYPG
jgi:hypothetical protein